MLVLGRYSDHAECLLQEKERLEKKLAKAEKEKKAQEAQSRSRNLMANFFGKQKAPAASSSATLTPSGSTSSVAQEKPATVSEFEKTFKPFLVKKDATLAPTNWFAEVRAGRTYKGKEKEDAVIVIDDDEDEPKKAERSNLHEDEDVQMVDASEWNGDDPHLGQKTPHGTCSSRTKENPCSSHCDRSSAGLVTRTTPSFETPCAPLPTTATPDTEVPPSLRRPHRHT